MLDSNKRVELHSLRFQLEAINRIWKSDGRSVEQAADKLMAYLERVALLSIQMLGTSKDDIQTPGIVIDATNTNQRSIRRIQNFYMAGNFKLATVRATSSHEPGRDGGPVLVAGGVIWIPESEHEAKDSISIGIGGWFGNSAENWIEVSSTCPNAADRIEQQSQVLARVFRSKRFKVQRNRTQVQCKNVAQ